MTDTSQGAFPSVFTVKAGDNLPDGSTAQGNHAFINTGMSLRDWFAGQALSGIITTCAGDHRGNGETVVQMFSRTAYELADAMLEARK